MTSEEYLEIERQAERRSEYWQGEMFAMAGASESHILIVANISVQLHGQLRGGACRVYPSEMRVRVSETGLYTYPDIAVVCRPPQSSMDAAITISNPTLLIEVLSPSTEAYDRGRKFELYQAIPSLRQYLLVDSERIHADLLTRQPDEQWLLRPTSSIEDIVELESIGCRISLRDSYELVLT